MLQKNGQIVNMSHMQTEVKHRFKKCDNIIKYEQMIHFLFSITFILAIKSLWVIISPKCSKKRLFPGY